MRAPGWIDVDRVAILVQGVVASQGTIGELTEGRECFEIELGTDRAPMEVLPGERAWLFAYAPLAWIYRVSVTGAIVLWVGSWSFTAWPTRRHITAIRL